MGLTIGLDIGGSKISGVVFDGKKSVHDLTIVTPKNLFEFQHNLGKLIAFLTAKDKITSIGVGMAGLVNKKKGIVQRSPNIKYIKNFPLVKFLSGKGFKKIEIDNDANCFLRGEFLLGSARGCKNAVGITLGTGIGGAFVIGGKFYRGSKNFGGEVGRMVMESSYWENLYQRTKDNKILAKLTAMGAANLINLFDPDCLVFGGWVSVHKQDIIKSAVREMGKYLQNPRPDAKVYVSKLKNAGALGAALLTKK